jgi:hypothetical protein
LVAAIPAAAAVLATVLNIVNLWLAARIVAVSGRLRRPWPDLSALTLPGFSLLVLAGAVAGSFLPDLAGVVSGAFAASLLMVFAVLGFAVLHAVTRGIGSRGFVLGGAYLSVFVLGWPVLGMALLGLAETVFNIRGRILHRPGPPAART